MYVKADFAYGAAIDVYRSPAGEELTYRYTTEEDGLHLRRYWTSTLDLHRFCLDLHRFRSGLLRAILAIKETGHGSDTQRRVQAGCGSHRAHQWPDTASGCV
jgi:hypothetical protein